MKNVSLVCKDNLCIGCGICKAICPFKAIDYKRKNGIYMPTIDKEKCKNCELCLKICPGKGFDYEKENPKCEDRYFGNYKKLLNVKSKNKTILHESTSGGFISTIVDYLLDTKEFDFAFLVNTYNYSEQVQTVKTDKLDVLNNPKSRYIPVSHTNSMEYILKNKDKKIILVGTSCFIQGFINVCNNYKLNRNNYLLIGLFCDKTMTLNVFNYFNKKINQKSNKKIEKLYFRTKDINGWPGDVKIINEDKKIIQLDRKERMDVKEYFCPERCLYCLDKANQFADFSVGDNYTNKFSSKEGSNSLIIRTDKAINIWNKTKMLFEYENIEHDELYKAMFIDRRKNNSKYIKLKKSDVLIPSFDKENPSKIDKKVYKRSLIKIKIGNAKNAYKIINLIKKIKK